MLSAVVGVNWGDEGKGRMVDLISNDYDVVVRYQGGNNAGHTVINEFGKFALNLLPSGIFRTDTLNILGPGTVIDIEHLVKEIDRVRAAGVHIDFTNLKISERAIICFPFHREQDKLEEVRLGSKKYGSTMRGIAPVYSDKYLKKGIQIGELLHGEHLESRLENLLEWKNKVITSVYNSTPFSFESMMEWLETYGSKIKEMICNSTLLINEAVNNNKNVLFEAQLGALRDIDFGIYPYTSSSSPLAAYAPIGAGVPMYKLDKVIGVIKAYSTCVGEGPFVVELFDEVGERIRDIGAEYGAATGRPRRVGYLDLVASKYGVQMQGATELALTKLDVLSSEKNIKICTAYKIGDRQTKTFPYTAELYKAEPIYEELPGWCEDIGNIREFKKMPVNAQRYIDFIENYLECKISYVSVGAKREEIIIR
ncbi:MAG: adenylosuccinate synthase [Deltaproteobacteria bacterium]